LAEKFYEFSLSKAKNQDDLVVKLFFLAAFVQFHFVDVHPFLDGNGRMCRFLSKFILDQVCPIPFPMFKDREEYFSTLTNGRNEKDPLNCPKHLLNLLFESAIQYYKEIISTHFDNGFDILCPAVTEDHLKQMIGNRKTEIQLKLIEEFQKLVSWKWNYHKFEFPKIQTCETERLFNQLGWFQ